ncbi:helix-turn-helix domain-containing protein, partial [Escherichia coli]|nr:helix-turn-helix domain-containing protein [Escherichia coli]
TDKTLSRKPGAVQGTGATEIAHQLSIARSTVYKILEDERAS